MGRGGSKLEKGLGQGPGSSVSFSSCRLSLVAEPGPLSGFLWSVFGVSFCLVVLAFLFGGSWCLRGLVGPARAMAPQEAEAESGSAVRENASAGQEQSYAQDQSDSWVWGDSSWNGGDRWAWWGWHRPYGYRHHWSWGARTESDADGGNFSSSTPSEGDDDRDSGRTDHQRRGSWNSSGLWTEDSTTKVPNSSGGWNSGQEVSVSKGSFSEKMAVPSFDAQSTGEELGVSARSYLRQVDAWCKVTRTPKDQQALLLYQHLSRRAWVESEELNVEDLAGSSGLSVFRTWIQERYQEIEVSKIAENLTAFFKRLRRQAGQTIREFNSAFDRSHSRLIEIDCRLPEVAKAWAYLNALSLSSSEELACLLQWVMSTMWLSFSVQRFYMRNQSGLHGSLAKGLRLRRILAKGVKASRLPSWLGLTRVMKMMR